MKTTLPETMRVLQADAYHSDQIQAVQNLRVVEKPVPVPGKGQLLVQMKSAACNPSDLKFLTGTYNIRKSLPTVPGFEGCGVVVASGGGLIGRLRMGKTVVLAGQNDRDGTWAEYYIAEAKSCLPLNAKISTDVGAYMLINPMTAAGLLDRVRRANSRAFVQTAAASHVGRILQVLARKSSIPVINIVRRPDQVAGLKKLGAEYVLDSSDRNFQEELKRLSHELQAKVALDCLSGSMTGNILSQMPDRSEVIVYGSLSGEPSSGIQPRDLSYHRKKITGFNLKNWVEERGILTVMQTFARLQKLFARGELETVIQKRIPLQTAKEGLLEYAKNLGSGKVVIQFE